MKALNLIAGLAFACLTTGSYAQGCAGHANAKGGGGADMASISKELGLNDTQKEAFASALASCQKDCSAMASKGGDAKEMTAAKADRFSTAIGSMKSVLTPEQYKQLETMNASGKLAGLCGEGCAKGSGKGCCAGKGGAKAEKASTEAQPTVQ